MRKLKVFNQVTLDGFFKGVNSDGEDDLSWGHEGQDDPEFQEFVQGNAGSGGELVFGRITYDRMAALWATAQASNLDPVVAKAMNERPKVVFSRTLKTADWNNTTLIKGDLPAQILKLKQAPGEPLTILGSGSLIPQLARAGLIDEYQLLVCPVVLGRGTSLFQGVKEALSLRLTSTRTFKNGKVLLSYGLVA